MMQNYTDEELSHAILKAVDAINMKKAVKAEPCFTLTEILVNKKLTALRNLAKIYKVRGYTGMDKKALAQSLVAKINDERVLEAHLMLLDELEWNLFRRAVEVQYLIPDKLFIDSYRMMLDLGIMELYYHDEKFHCIVSEEIKETYAKLQRIGLAEEKDHAVLLNNYAAAAVHLYGVISQDDFVDLFNSQNDRKINTDEVFSILIKYVSMEYGYAFWDEYIVSDYLEQNAYKDVANYVKAASRFPRYVPDKDDLLKYADGSYFDETKHTAKLREYINTHLADNADITDEIVEEIVYLSFTDTKFQNIFNIFDKHGIEFKSQGQAEQFMAVLVEAYNSSRKWSNNGHTPAEVQGIYKVNPIKPLKGQEEKFTFAIKKEEPIISQPKVGRNEPCPCGSGKKYKKCCSA